MEESEIERLWAEFDHAHGYSDNEGFRIRDIHKQALREDIENRISDCMIIVDDHDMANDQWLYSKAEISAFKKVLLLLDTVKPPKQ